MQPTIEGVIAAFTEQMEVSYVRKQLREVLGQQWIPFDEGVRRKIEEFFRYFKEEVKQILGNSSNIGNAKKFLSLAGEVEKTAPSAEVIQQWLKKLDVERGVI